MTFNVTILGSNSAIPTIRRNPTAQLINYNERLFLMDCAEGTQLQLMRYRIRYQRIRHILISHLHGDHYFGLVGLLSTFHLLGRKEGVTVYGPGGLEEIIRMQLEASQTALCYTLDFITTDDRDSGAIYEDDRLMIRTLPMDHRIACHGFLFREKKGLRRLRKGHPVIDQIPVGEHARIQRGAGFTTPDGIRHSNSEITIDPEPLRTYACCSDTRYNESIIPLLQGADLLYHEATFDHTLAAVAREKYHSTASEAATIAAKARVGKLIIGHFSNRYDDPAILLQEAQEIFPNTETAEEGRVFNVEHSAAAPSAP